MKLIGLLGVLLAGVFLGVMATPRAYEPGRIECYARIFDGGPQCPGVLPGQLDVFGWKYSVDSPRKEHALPQLCFREVPEAGEIVLQGGQVIESWVLAIFIFGKSGQMNRAILGFRSEKKCKQVGSYYLNRTKSYGVGGFQCVRTWPGSK